MFVTTQVAKRRKPGRPADPRPQPKSRRRIEFGVRHCGTDDDENEVLLPPPRTHTSPPLMALIHLVCLQDPHQESEGTSVQVSQPTTEGRARRIRSSQVPPPPPPIPLRTHTSLAFIALTRHVCLQDQHQESRTTSRHPASQGSTAASSQEGRIKRVTLFIFMEK